MSFVVLEPTERGIVYQLIYAPDGIETTSQTWDQITKHVILNGQKVTVQTYKNMGSRLCLDNKLVPLI